MSTSQLEPVEICYPTSGSTPTMTPPLSISTSRGKLSRSGSSSTGTSSLSFSTSSSLRVGRDQQADTRRGPSRRGDLSRGERSRSDLDVLYQNALRQLGPRLRFSGERQQGHGNRELNGLDVDGVSVVSAATNCGIDDPYEISALSLRFVRPDTERQFVREYYGVYFCGMLTLFSVASFVLIGLIGLGFVAPSLAERMWVEVGSRFGQFGSLLSVEVGTACFAIVVFCLRKRGCSAEGSEWEFCERSRKKTGTGSLCDDDGEVVDGSDGMGSIGENGTTLGFVPSRGVESTCCCGCFRGSVVGNVFDIIYTIACSIVLVLQGVDSGYYSRGKISQYFVAALGTIMIMRVRVVPVVPIVYSVGILSHFVCMGILITDFGWKDSGIDIPTIITSLMIALVMLLPTILTGWFIERQIRKLFVTEKKWKDVCHSLGEENNWQNQIMANIIPTELIPVLKTQDRFLRTYDHLAVVINDLAGFTNFCSSVETHVVFRLVKDVYSRFDDVSLACGLEKVKTIGDSFVGIVFSLKGEETVKRNVLVAVAAGLRMNAAFCQVIDELSAASPDQSNLSEKLRRLDLRTGISMGKATVFVITGTREKSTQPDMEHGQLRRLTFDVVGEAVARAESLQVVADVGTVYCCERVHSALESEMQECCSSVQCDDLSFPAFRIDTPKSDCFRIVDGTGSANDESEIEILRSNETVSSSSLSCCAWLWSKVRCCFCTGTSLKEEIQQIREIYLQQTQFVSICYGVILPAVWYQFAATVATYPAPFGEAIHLHLTLGILCLLISVSCVCGIVFARRKSFSGLHLQWLVWVLLHCYCLLVFVPAVYIGLDDCFFMIDGVSVLMPFVSVLLPSIPFMLKVVVASYCPIICCIHFIIYMDVLPTGDWWRIVAVSTCIVWACGSMGVRNWHNAVLESYLRQKRVRCQFQLLDHERLRSLSLITSSLPMGVLRACFEGKLEKYFDDYADGGAMFCIVSGLPSSGEGLVSALEVVFSQFDEYASGIPCLAKVKSTGNRYLSVSWRDDVAAGSILASPAERLAHVALKMMEAMLKFREEGKVPQETYLRIGLHLGGFCGGLVWSFLLSR